jgi:hypothetical protein
MGVTANTVETYANTVLREDLQEAYVMISPTKTPFQQLCGRKTIDNTLWSWPLVSLASPAANRVIEGEAAPGNDAGTLAKRLSNYTQISDKVVEVSRTSQVANAAADNVQRMGKQVLIKMKELKRDMELMLLSNVPAVPGSSGVARQTAGLPAFLRTNTVGGAGGAAPTLSGTTEGYPNAAATLGTVSVFLEVTLNNMIEACYIQGGNPSVIMVNTGNKRRLSTVFTGNATRYKDAIDKRLTAAIDIYDSDFGEFTVVPNIFQPVINTLSYGVYILDPDYLTLAFYDTMKQKPLAETGHSIRNLIWAEYGLQVDAEVAHAMIRDTSNALS